MTPVADRFALVARLLLLAALLAGIYLLGDTLTGQVREWLAPHLPAHGLTFLLLGLLLYVLFMAIPFVPGIEVGLVVMLLGGREGIIVVYVATVLALSLSYGLGWLVPAPALGGLLGWLGLRRAAGLVRELAELPHARRLPHLTRHLPGRWLPFLLRHRYLAVAIVLNTPGNAVIGGGGGIGMVAGMSGLFSFLRYLGLIALAVLPVPLMLLVKASL